MGQITFACNLLGEILEIERLEDNIHKALSKRKNQTLQQSPNQTQPKGCIPILLQSSLVPRIKAVK